MRHVEPGADSGERVSPLYANDLFYAHLSLYAFCARWAPDARVLDVGCGTGYGAARLAEAGARAVLGIDVDPAALSFGRERFAGPALRFERHAAEDLDALVGGPFDLIVALNTLEHVPGVDTFLRASSRRLSPDGTLVVAVPPVTNPRERLAELANPYHLNIWSPRQWATATGRWFAEVALFRHDFLRTDVEPDFRNKPDRTVLRETDFACRGVSDPGDLGGTYTVVLVATAPRPDALPSSCSSPATFVDDSITRAPPRWTPLAPDLIDLPLRPWRSLPVHAARLARARGLRGVGLEARHWMAWRIRRALAERELRRPPSSGR